MNLDALFARIHQAVDEVAYLTPVVQVAPNQRAAMADIRQAFESTTYEVSACEEVIARCYRAGRVDKVMMYSALHVLHAHPKVGDY